MTELRTHLNQQLAGMTTEQSSFMRHWMDISDYAMPRTSRFFVTDRNRGNLRNPKINDNTATLALRALRAGMMSGITNPARPWISMRTTDPDLNKWHGTRVYLDIVRDAMAEIFLKSNLYNILPGTYGNLGGYGTDNFDLDEDPDTIIRCYPNPMGSYFLACDERGTVGTRYRKFQQTSLQLVKKFGIGNVTTQVAEAYNRSDYTSWFTIYHALEPNPDYIPGSISPMNMAYRSIYWEHGSSPDKYLRHSGYHGKPFIASRWDVVGEDIYGSSPMMDALGDVMALQLEQRRKVTVIDKHVNPPTSAPIALEKKGVSNVPGGVTYVDVMGQNQGITPNYQTRLEGMQYLLQDLEETRGRINSALYKDLFLMVSQAAPNDKTAYEIAALQEEKLLGLGPVYLRVNDEVLDNLTSRTMQIMIDRSRPYWEGKLNGAPIIPPPPPELQNADISFEYISIMSQAMKAVGVNAIQRSLTFAGSMQQSFPDILDNVNSDASIRYFFNVSGTPTETLNSEEQVKQIRAVRAKQEAAQQALASAQQGASAAKDLSQASLSDNNALSQLMGRLQSPQGA